MSKKTFKFDMYVIGDRLLEGVIVLVEVNIETSEITLDYYNQSDREYVKSLGAPGTDDYWLNEAKKYLKERWEEFIE